ncbi:ABC transporter permease [Burkholderia theae]|uniref:ABC transporter permease n=1 Tax=Burkholderia theae TaxID=3143496 RepID=UPI003AFA64F4
MEMTTALVPDPARSAFTYWLGRHASVASIAAFFLVCTAVFALSSATFHQTGNLFNIARQCAPLLIVATAMTVVITTGGIDLSVGSTLALVGALCAMALQAGMPEPVVIGGGLVLGCAIGLLNGYFVAYAGMPPFIVTLGTLSIVRGAALAVTQGYSLPIEHAPLFTGLGRQWVLGIPLPVLLAVAVVLAGWAALRYTRFGRYVTGLGCNEESVRRAGVDVRRIKLRAYLLSGMAAALAGMIIAARLGSGSSNQGTGFELDVITAVVLGGTSLFGGVGTIVGTVLGALTIAVLNNGLILLHVSPFYTQILQGSIMLLAIWLNTRVFMPRRRHGSAA